MSSRSESKQAAREAREAAEQESASRARRQRTWAIVGGSVLLAAVVVVALIVLSSSDSGDAGDTGDATVFEGVPQMGIALGDPDAPVTMVEFADPQCPFCMEYSENVLPDLVEKYVKTGDLRMELNLLTFIGPDSESLARAAYAASEEDGMWQFTDIAYARQGTENSGYADQAFIDSVSEAAGLDPDQINSASGSEAVTRQLADANTAAQDAGISSTPGFQIGPTGGELTTLDVAQLETSQFEDAIDQQLASAK